MPSMVSGEKEIEYEVKEGEGRLIIKGVKGKPTLRDLTHAFNGDVWINALDDMGRILKIGEKFSYTG